MDKILLFIPMYNCEKQIVRVLNQLNGSILKYISEVIIVNNRSTDDGETAVIEYLKNKDMPFTVKLLRNRENYGLGGSHKVAFNYAVDNNFDYIIVLHGDDQGSIKDLLKPLKLGMHKKYDCLLGSRFCKGAKRKGYSAFRVFGNYVFNSIYSIATKSIITDMGSGLNMYCVDILKDRKYLKFTDNLTFNNLSLLALSFYKKSYKFIPIHWKEEDQVSNAKLFNQSIILIKLAWGAMFGKKEFFEKEHRTKIIDNYLSDVVYKNK